MVVSVFEALLSDPRRLLPGAVFAAFEQSDGSARQPWRASDMNTARCRATTYPARLARLARWCATCRLLLSRLRKGAVSAVATMARGQDSGGGGSPARDARNSMAPASSMSLTTMVHLTTSP